MFDTTTLIICIIGTVLIFSWLFTYKEKEARIFFLFFGTMYLIYSGLGSALSEVSKAYIYYYFIFTTCISIGISFGLHYVKNNNRTIKKSWSVFLTEFIKRLGDKIIVIYLLLLLIPLIYPEFKLVNLISPPTPDVISMLAERFSGEEEGIITKLTSGLTTIIYPFYLLSLYKYATKTFKLSVIVVLSYYIQYCASGYLGRGSMLEALLIIIAFTYFSRPRLGKIILIGSASLFPLLLVFFVQYSITRIGGTAESMSYSEAFGTLLEQESGYPKHFSRILNYDNGNYILNFLVWLFTMPLPGFFRGGMDAHFAAIFSENMLGITRGSRGFYILLPGVVGESVFLMGQNLFWFNGLVYGFLMGAVYRLLTRYPQLLGILIVTVIDFGYKTNRAGLFGGLPWVLKILFYFLIILMIVKKMNHWPYKRAKLA